MLLAIGRWPVEYWLPGYQWSLSLLFHGGRQPTLGFNILLVVIVTPSHRYVRINAIRRPINHRPLLSMSPPSTKS